MTVWWRKGLTMPSYVTQEHFDATVSGIKEEFRAFRVENSTRLDEIITILQRLDQERVFTIEWIRRIEADVSVMKKHLKLA